MCCAISKPNPNPSQIAQQILQIVQTHKLCATSIPSDVVWCVQLDGDDCRDHVEVCPKAAVIAAEIADRVATFNGFALIADYGHNGEKTDTFRVPHFHRISIHKGWTNPLAHSS